MPLRYWPVHQGKKTANAHQRPRADRPQPSNNWSNFSTVSFIEITPHSKVVPTKSSSSSSRLSSIYSSIFFSSFWISRTSSAIFFLSNSSLIMLPPEPTTNIITCARHPNKQHIPSMLVCAYNKLFVVC
jgi:hypothetical protein